MLTQSQCNEFILNPSRNPLTRRAIKIDGPTHKKLTNWCAAYSKNIPKPSRNEKPVPIPNSTKKKDKSSDEETEKKERKPLIQSVCIMVFGLGCSETPEENYRYIEKLYTRNFGMQVIAMCNPKLGNTISTILKSVCYIIPNLKSKFVQEVCEKVEYFLRQKIRVYLIGHSYGGCVVARVAELFCLNKFITNPDLIILTFGSIYIPEQKKVNGLNVSHYMFRDDVALKCNKLVYEKDQRSDVKWLRPINYATPVKRKFSLFGTETEWEYHNSYNIEDLFKQNIIKD